MKTADYIKQDCGYKHSFTSKVDALKALTRTNRNKDCTLNVYKCSNCFKFHVGSTIKVKK